MYGVYVSRQPFSFACRTACAHAGALPRAIKRKHITYNCYKYFIKYDYFTRKYSVISAVFSSKHCKLYSA